MNPYLIAQREKSKTFLIICEGENTEPEYFKAFPVKTATIKSYGLGSSKSKLVEYVLEITEHETDEDQEVWIVFDMDLKLQDDIDKQKEDYENAISTATAAGLKVAHSNDSFELWLILHYQYIDSNWTRHEYYKRLSQLWECNYEKEAKKRKYCALIYQRLQEDERSDQNRAIAHAEKLEETQEEITLAEKCPHTTVHQLVTALNEYL